MFASAIDIAHYKGATCISDAYKEPFSNGFKKNIYFFFRWALSNFKKNYLKSRIYGFVSASMCFNLHSAESVTFHEYQDISYIINFNVHYQNI